jgi:hypothetical protein
MALSITGCFVVTSGTQSLAGSALEVGCDAGDGSA